MAKNSDDNLIHVKLEYQEAVNGKRDVLVFERDLIRVLQRMKTYHKFRSEELKYKLRIYKKIKELKSGLNKLKNTLPKIEIPKFLSEGREEIKHERRAKKGKEDLNLDLDRQLKEIQERLRSLEWKYFKGWFLRFFYGKKRIN